MEGPRPRTRLEIGGRSRRPRDARRNLPAPIYEGDDSIIAWLLDGPDAQYVVRLPDVGESPRAILDTYTKAYSAEIQAQAWIDLAFSLRERIGDLADIDEIEIHTSHHTHRIIGSGSGDPQKYSPDANRETLDHSLMYIFAVALQDGSWHHDTSYRRERATRPDTVALWQRIHTVEDGYWDARYHDPDPERRAFGGRVIVKMRDGHEVIDQIDVADAHPRGARPFGRGDYLTKFSMLAGEFATTAERERFLAATCALPQLTSGRLGELNVVVPATVLEVVGIPTGLFERRGS